MSDSTPSPHDQPEDAAPGSVAEALGLFEDIADTAVLARAARHLRARGVRLPAVAELADPTGLPETAIAELAAVDPDAPDPRNLYRIHWHNAGDRRARCTVPEHVVLPPELTGVTAPIAVALGDRFPLIGAHKVLAAYACLAPRLAAGRFDPAAQRALWPSTGNYCRGGVAVSRILGCRGVAILPEGMSRERFAWLERWVEEPTDIVRTPGSESDVKEIYDVCDELERDGANVVINQFREFGNHLAHRTVTGAALERIAEHLRAARPSLRPRLFVAASGSAGTLGAGHHLAERFSVEVAAVEALECPTLLENGYGSHRIQGIGDKHVPLICDAYASDHVVAVSDRATDRLYAAFQSEQGRRELADTRAVPEHIIVHLDDLGLSSICNVVACVRLARELDLGPDDLVLTVATDGAALYRSELPGIHARSFDSPDGAAPGRAACAGAFAEHLIAAGPARTLPLDDGERRRIFNLGYYTWVEQRGVPLEAFEARRERAFWHALPRTQERWDGMIRELDERIAKG